MIQIIEATTTTNVKFLIAEAVFGTGDIGLSNRYEENEVWLSPSNEKPEAEWNPETPAEVPITEGMVAIALKFNSVKSIDNLILNLNEIKDSMLLAKNKTTGTAGE